MTWNLKHAGIPSDSTVLYDSPFSSSSSKYAIGSSKINHGVAQYLYPAENVRTSLNIQSAPVPSKAHSMRYTLDANSVTNFVPGGVLTSKDVYDESLKQMAESYKKESYTITSTIDNSSDFREVARKNYKLIDEVVRQMMVNSSAILQHKVYGTELPSWYIHKICFLILLEQAMADEYGDENVNKKAISSPVKALDLILSAYNRATVEKKENWSLFRKDGDDEAIFEFPETYSDVSIPEQYRKTLKVNYQPWMKLTDEEKEKLTDINKRLNEQFGTDKSIRKLEDFNAIDSMLNAHAESYLNLMTSDESDEKKAAVSSIIDEIAAIVTPDEVVDVHDEQVVVVPDEVPQPVIDQIKEEVVEEPTPSAIALAPVVHESCMMKLAAVDNELLKLVNSAIYKEKSAPMMVIDAPVQVNNDSKRAALQDEIAKAEAEIKKLNSKSKLNLYEGMKLKILNLRLDELKAKLPKEGWISHVSGAVPAWKGVRGRREKYSISGTHRTPWPKRLGVRSFRKENYEGEEEGLSFIDILLIVVIIILCVYIYKQMNANKIRGGRYYNIYDGY